MTESHASKAIMNQQFLEKRLKIKYQQQCDLHFCFYIVHLKKKKKNIKTINVFQSSTFFPLYSTFLTTCPIRSSTGTLDNQSCMKTMK